MEERSQPAISRRGDAEYGARRPSTLVGSRTRSRTSGHVHRRYHRAADCIISCSRWWTIRLMRRWRINAQNLGENSGFRGSAAPGAAVDAQLAHMDPDLAAIIARWPDLPNAIKAGIVAMGGGDRALWSASRAKVAKRVIVTCWDELRNIFAELGRGASTRHMSNLLIRIDGGRQCGLSDFGTWNFKGTLLGELLMNERFTAAEDFSKPCSHLSCGAILADPPWQFSNRTGKVASEHKRLSRYTTLTLGRNQRNPRFGCLRRAMPSLSLASLAPLKPRKTQLDGRPGRIWTKGGLSARFKGVTGIEIAISYGSCSSGL